MGCAVLYISYSSGEFDKVTYTARCILDIDHLAEDSLCFYQIEGSGILRWLIVRDRHKAPGALLLQVICGIETDLMLEQCIAENLGIQRHVPGKQS